MTGNKSALEAGAERDRGREVQQLNNSTINKSMKCWNTSGNLLHHCRPLLVVTLQRRGLATSHLIKLLNEISTRIQSFSTDYRVRERERGIKKLIS